MKILSKIKKRPLILGILFTMFLIGIVYAATSYQVNSGAQVTINEWSVCQKVTNNNALAIFVPTNTAAEWTAFRTYASGVTYASCCSANGVACSSDASCCSAICGTNADGDAYFSSAAGHTGICQATSKLYTDCCDSDNRAYPGETTYYTSINNCSSWDYDCSGTTSKSDCTVRSATTSSAVTCWSSPTCASSYTRYLGCTYGSTTSLSCGGTGTYYSCLVSTCRNPADGCTTTRNAYYRSGSSRNCACK